MLPLDFSLPRFCRGENSPRAFLLGKRYSPHPQRKPSRISHEVLRKGSHVDLPHLAKWSSPRTQAEVPYWGLSVSSIFLIVFCFLFCGIFFSWGEGGELLLFFVDVSFQELEGKDLLYVRIQVFRTLSSSLPSVYKYHWPPHFDASRGHQSFNKQQMHLAQHLLYTELCVKPCAGGHR